MSLSLLNIGKRIILEYTEKIKKQLLLKYKKENSELTDEQITFYIDRFSQIKDSLPNNERDIFKYTFSDLEQKVDAFKSNKKISKDLSNNDEDLILDKDGVKVYRSDDEKKCISLGKGYTWCISREQGNLFYNYRSGSSGSKKTPLSFYFVFDKTLDIKDPYHAFILYAYEDGTFGVTSSVNDPKKGLGDIVNLTWEKFLSIINKHTASVISSLKNEIVFNPLSDEENIIYKFKKGTITPEEFINLPYSQKEMYVQVAPNMQKEIFPLLPKELAMLYINSIDLDNMHSHVLSNLITSYIKEHSLERSFFLLKRIHSRMNKQGVNSKNKIEFYKSLGEPIVRSLLDNNIISKEEYDIIFFDTTNNFRKVWVVSSIEEAKRILTIKDKPIEILEKIYPLSKLMNGNYILFVKDGNNEYTGRYVEINSNFEEISDAYYNKKGIRKNENIIQGNFSPSLLAFFTIHQLGSNANKIIWPTEFSEEDIDIFVQQYNTSIKASTKEYQYVKYNLFLSFNNFKDKSILLKYFKSFPDFPRYTPLYYRSYNRNNSHTEDYKPGDYIGVVGDLKTGKVIKFDNETHKIRDKSIRDIIITGIDKNLPYVIDVFDTNTIYGKYYLNKLITTKPNIELLGFDRIKRLLLLKGQGLEDLKISNDKIEFIYKDGYKDNPIKINRSGIEYKENEKILGAYFDEYGWPYRKTQAFLSPATLVKDNEILYNRFGKQTILKRLKMLGNRGVIYGAILAMDRDILVFKLNNGEYVGWWRIGAAGDFVAYRGGRVNGGVNIINTVISQISLLKEGIKFKDFFKEEIEAYHGTPFKFNKFQVVAPKNSQLSSGWGIYFHTYRDFAKNFTQGRKSSNVYFNGYDAIDMHDLTDNTVFLKIPTWVTNAYDIQDFVDSMIETYKEKYEEKRQEGESEENLISLKHYIQEYYDFLDIIKDMEITQKQSNYVYKVLLFKGKSPSEYNLLDERTKTIKPDQLKQIQDQLNKENIPIKLPTNISAHSIYKLIQNKHFGNQKDTSLFMIRAGIDGVIKKYNGPGEGVIIFDAKNIEIQSVEEFSH